ncbi:MAG TPA: aspartate aminotransferase family protein [Candidatus Bathyarchaeia archaeon]|nr:aspartate aminotransferase family protein [Candidatus Bathyarchaeia archaeon]
MTGSGARIPETGTDRQVLLDRMQAMRVADVQWRQNKAFGLVYRHSDAHTELIKTAYGLFLSENGLNPMAFKSLQVMEREVVGMTANMFHGDADAVGSMTSGGTESLLLAVLTYRNHARRKRPWIRKPEIVVPDSAHVGFTKAGEYFDVRIVRTPLRADYRADVAALESRINRNTIGIVGSAPSYPYGIIDPIQELGEVALRHGVPLHVDGCLGGFFLPWVEKLGHRIPPFDFRVPGVTSISADLHKYGYAAKGASSIIYRSLDFFRDQIFAEVDWCGGVYGGATMAGTRPGGAIAAAWASLHSLGQAGYMENARAVMEATRIFMDGVRAIPGLCVLGEPEMSVFAFGAKDNRISMYAVADKLEQSGWHVDRLQRPESIHLIINAGHGQVADRYLADLRAAVDHVAAHPETALEGQAPMYGLIAKAPLRKMVKRNVVNILAQLYIQRETGADDEEEVGADSVPKPVMQLLRLKMRIRRMFQRPKS